MPRKRRKALPTETQVMTLPKRSTGVKRRGKKVTSLMANKMTAAQLRVRMQIASYYAAPALIVQRTKVLLSRQPRWASEETMHARSIMLQRPHAYDTYFTRSLSKSEQVSEILQRVQISIGEVVRDAVVNIRRDIPQTELEPTVCDYMYNGKGSVDALFCDVYRMLLGRRDLFTPTPDGRRSYGVAQTLRSMPEFMMLKEQVNGDTANAAVAAVLLLNNMFNTNPEDSSTTQQEKKAMRQYVAGGVTKDDVRDSVRDPEDPNSDQDAPTSATPPQPSQQATNGVRTACDTVRDTLAKLQASAGQQPQGDDEGTPKLAKARTVRNDDDEDAEDGDTEDGEENDTQSTGASDESADVQSDPTVIPDLLAVVNHYLRDAQCPSVLHEGGKNMVWGGMPDAWTIRDNVVKLFSVFGRVNASIGEAVTMSRYGDGDTIEVTLGGEPQNALGSELVSLCVDELEDIFYMRLAEHQLLQRNRVGVDDAGHGSMVIALDVSSSMHSSTEFPGVDHPISLETIAGAFAMSITRYAMEWGRSVIVVPFNGSVQMQHVFVGTPDMRTNKRYLKEALTRVCTLIPNGGTSFSCVFDVLPKLFERMGKDAENADVIFFTDGEPYEYGKGSYGWRKDQKLVEKLPEGMRSFGLCITARGDDMHTVTRLQQSNAKWFDACSVCSPLSIERGIQELWDSIVKASFYKQVSDDAA